MESAHVSGLRTAGFVGVKHIFTCRYWVTKTPFANQSEDSPEQSDQSPFREERREGVGAQDRAKSGGGQAPHLNVLFLEKVVFCKKF